jgi:hypothetical protein
MAQDLRQIGRAELTGSTRAVRESGEADTRLLVLRSVGHEASGERIGSRSLSFLIYPDQRPKCDERTFLLRRRPEAAIGPLPCEEGGQRPPGAFARFGGADCEQRLDGVKEIGARPGSVLGLVGDDGGGQRGKPVSSRSVHIGESMNRGDLNIRGEVTISVVPLGLKLNQADDMPVDRLAVCKPRPKRRAQRQAADPEPGGRVRSKDLSIRQHHRSDPMVWRCRGEETRDEVLAGAVRVARWGTAFAESARPALKLQYPCHDPYQFRAVGCTAEIE